MRRYIGMWDGVGNGEHVPKVLILDGRPDAEDQLEVPRTRCDRPGNWSIVGKQLAVELLADALGNPVVPTSLVDRFRFDVVESLPERWEMGADEVRDHAERLRMEVE
jgi:hypothetical protein